MKKTVMSLILLLATNSYGANKDPVLLEKIDFNQGEHRGFESFDEAYDLCERYVALYKDQYFFVYCNFLDKRWKTVQLNTDFYKDYRFLGYSINSSSSSYRSSFYNSTTYNDTQRYSRSKSRTKRDRYHGVWVKKATNSSSSYNQSTTYSNGSSFSSSHSYYNQTPNYKSVWIPYTHRSEINHKLWGIEIYGQGLINENTPWKRIFSSKEFGDGYFSLSYPSRIKSLIACKKLLLTLALTDNQGQFYRAKCTPESDKGLWYYNLNTQNPFI